MSTLRNERENLKRKQPDDEIKLYPGQAADPELQLKLDEARKSSRKEHLSASVKTQVVIDHENQHSPTKVANPITLKAQQDARYFSQISGAQIIEAVERTEETDFENQRAPSWTKNAPSPKPETKKDDPEEAKKTSLPNPFKIPECRKD